MTGYLLTIDLNTTRLNNQSYLHLLSELNHEKCEIHIYNYIEQKHNKLPFNNGEIIHQYSGSRKKVALDIPQALDTIELCTKNNYLGVYILCGDFESEFLFNKLNKMKVNYTKILPTSLRCADNYSHINGDIIINKSEPQIIANESLTDTNVIQVASSDTRITNSNNKQENKQIPDLSTYSSNQKISGTKLTPEQSKKIYTYIKFKQMQRELKTL